MSREVVDLATVRSTRERGHTGTALRVPTLSIPVPPQQHLGDEIETLPEYRVSLLSAGKSLGTVEQRVQHMRRLAVEHRRLTDVQPIDLETFLARRRLTHAAETRKSIRSSFQSYYRWAHKRGIVSVDPAIDLDPISIPRTIPRVAADADLQLALITADDHERAMIFLARFACLRLNELTTLHTRQREGDLLRIIGKGEKERLVPANDDVMHALTILEREQGAGYYFPGRMGAHMHPVSVGKIIKRRTGWNPHSMRHAGATAAYRATGDLRAVQEFLGHASLATTQRYLHPILDDVRKVAASTGFVERRQSPHFAVA